MARVLATVLLLVSLAGAQDVWVPDQAQLLPAFRQPEVLPGERVQEWTFAAGIEEWHPRSETVALAHVAEIGHDAVGCLRVRGHEDKGWNFAWSPGVPVVAGGVYRVVLWLRVEGEGAAPPSAHYFKVQMFKPRGQKGGAQVGSQRIPVAVTGEWQRLTTRFSVPKEGLDRVAIALEKGTREDASVDVLIDDVGIEQVSQQSVERVWRDAPLRGPITGELRGVHPRLYLTKQRLASLRQLVRDDPYWQAQLVTLRGHADRALRHQPPDYNQKMSSFLAGNPVSGREQLWQREVGNLIPQVALVYLLTGERAYLDACKAWAFAAIDYPTWGAGPLAGVDLAAGHLLAGIGLAYDWLYANFTPAERERIRNGVVPRAERLARAGFHREVPWHQSYLQNHQWVSLGGLATTAFAMVDEVPEAASWICFAHDKFVRTLQALGDDGASHERYGYWEYGAEYIMRYLELADGCLGIDLYVDGKGRPHPWLSRNAAYALHLALPREMWTRRQSIMDLADGPRNHWYGPSHLLHNLARRYPESKWSQTAQWLAGEMLAAGVDAGGGSHFLNFAWHGPAIPSRSPKASGLPLQHHFRDLGIVSARSAWVGNAAHLVVKCGPPLGHKHVDSAIDYGAGHVHPDAGHFILAARGEILFRDSGYTHHKLSGNHSTLLVNGRGQKGEGQKWFTFGDWRKDRRAPRIRSLVAGPGTDVIQCEVAPAYPLDLGVEQFDRTFAFDRARKIAIDDTVRTVAPAMLEWRFQVEGSQRQVSATEWVTTQGAVSATIRLSASIPIVCSEGTLTINEHIRAREAKYLSVRSKGKVTAATLQALIEVAPGE
ncbi:MAG: DUF4962 domain-containing protein [Victivallales bacterium]|nr:DUF4962 domain-containing protein [Victivallales bacterium]